MLYKLWSTDLKCDVEKEGSEAGISREVWKGVRKTCDAKSLKLSDANMNCMGTVERLGFSSVMETNE